MLPQDICSNFVDLLLAQNRLQQDAKFVCPWLHCVLLQGKTTSALPICLLYIKTVVWKSGPKVYKAVILHRHAELLLTVCTQTASNYITEQDQG